MIGLDYISEDNATDTLIDRFLAPLHICDQLERIEPGGVDDADAPQVGCAFGSVVELPPIPLGDAVKACQEISAKIPR